MCQNYNQVYVCQNYDQVCLCKNYDQVYVCKNYDQVYVLLPVRHCYCFFMSFPLPGSFSTFIKDRKLSGNQSA